MKKIVEEAKTLEDGKYEGVITKVEYRTQPYEYVDLVIETQGVKLKAGYPFKIMPESKLGILLMKFGAILKIGEMIDPDEHLIGKKCAFMVIKKGKYANILGESVQPLQDKTTADNLRAADYEHN